MIQIPQMDEKMVKMAMKRMGIKQEDIKATRVIIETPDKNIVINNPVVSKIDMQGNISFQINGDISEKIQEYKPLDEDIDLVKEKTGASRLDVIKSLKKND